VVDTEFHLVAAISVQNAARAAALYISSSSVPVGMAASAACSVVTKQLQSLPNHLLFQAGCSSGPLQVTASQTSTPAAVTVKYQTMSLIPVPFLFSGPFPITRSATFLVRSN
jgi:hypothetical protein